MRLNQKKNKKQISVATTNRELANYWRIQCENSDLAHFFVVVSIRKIDKAPGVGEEKHDRRITRDSNHGPRQANNCPSYGKVGTIYPVSEQNTIAFTKFCVSLRMKDKILLQDIKDMLSLSGTVAHKSTDKSSLFFYVVFISVFICWEIREMTVIKLVLVIMLDRTIWLSFTKKECENEQEEVRQKVTEDL